jgi:hypothetical protein
LIHNGSGQTSPDSRHHGRPPVGGGSPLPVLGVARLGEAAFAVHGELVQHGPGIAGSITEQLGALTGRIVAGPAVVPLS